MYTWRWPKVEHSVPSVARTLAQKLGLVLQLIPPPSHTLQSRVENVIHRASNFVPLRTGHIRSFRAQKDWRPSVFI